MNARRRARRTHKRVDPTNPRRARRSCLLDMPATVATAGSARGNASGRTDPVSTTGSTPSLRRRSRAPVNAMTPMIDLHPTADRAATGPSVARVRVRPHCRRRRSGDRGLAFVWAVAALRGTHPHLVRAVRGRRQARPARRRGASPAAPRSGCACPASPPSPLRSSSAAAPKLAAVVTAVVGGFSVVVGWAVQDAPLTAEWGSRIGVGGGFVALLGATVVITTASQRVHRCKRPSASEGATTKGLRGPERIERTD